MRGINMSTDRPTYVSFRMPHYGQLNLADIIEGVVVQIHHTVTMVTQYSHLIEDVTITSEPFVDEGEHWVMCRDSSGREDKHSLVDMGVIPDNSGRWHRYNYTALRRYV